SEQMLVGVAIAQSLKQRTLFQKGLQRSVGPPEGELAVSLAAQRHGEVPANFRIVPESLASALQRLLGERQRLRLAVRVDQQDCVLQDGLGQDPSG
ncbi:MAG: hypothetical protein ACK56I_21285, partial [bacterium]